MRTKTNLLIIIAFFAATFFTGNVYANISSCDSILSSISGCAEAKATVLLEGWNNGVKDCLPAFKKAIKKAQALIDKHGTARVMVPPGEYLLNGPLHFISGLTLEIQEGATLRFSDNPAHYLPVVETSWEGTYCCNYSPFIYGKNLHDIAIVGKGTIDGNANVSFCTWRNKQGKDSQLLRDYNHNQTSFSDRVFGDGCFLRPQLIQFYDCERVTIEGIFITNSPFWCVHLLRCNNVVCRSLRYDAKLDNNDGIDPESSRNVLIEDIIFNNGDDNIAIKSGRDHDGRTIACPSENIIIRRCSFKGLHAVVLGSEMSGGIRNVWIEDCTFGGYCKRGLYIKTNPDRGAFIHDIYMDNCQFGKVEDLIYVTSMFSGEGLDNNHFTDIHDIYVSNVTCQEANNAAIVLQGTVARPLRNIFLENVNVNSAKIGNCMTNTDIIGLKNCNIGGRTAAIPTIISDEDNIFRED